MVVYRADDDKASSAARGVGRQVAGLDPVIAGAAVVPFRCSMNEPARSGRAIRQRARARVASPQQRAVRWWSGTHRRNRFGPRHRLRAHRPHLVNSPSTPEETLLEFVVTATQPAHGQGGPRDLVGVAANPLDGVDDAGHDDDAREGELGKDLPADRGLADSRPPAEPSHGDEIVVHRLAIRGRGDRLLVLHPGEGQQRRVAAPGARLASAGFDGRRHDPPPDRSPVPAFGSSDFQASRVADLAVDVPRPRRVGALPTESDLCQCPRSPAPVPDVPCTRGGRRGRSEASCSGPAARASLREPVGLGVVHGGAAQPSRSNATTG